MLMLIKTRKEDIVKQQKSTNRFLDSVVVSHLSVLKTTRQWDKYFDLLYSMLIEAKLDVVVPEHVGTKNVLLVEVLKYYENQDSTDGYQRCAKLRDIINEVNDAHEMASTNV